MQNTFRTSVADPNQLFYVPLRHCVSQLQLADFCQLINFAVNWLKCVTISKCITGKKSEFIHEVREILKWRIEFHPASIFMLAQ